jgi:sec-independent protein translocase protein TatB
MFNIGPAELIVILLVALLIVGPKRLPEVGKSVGKALREIRKQTDEVRSSFEATINPFDDDDDTPAVEDHTGSTSSDLDTPTEWGGEDDAPAPEAAPLPEVKSKRSRRRRPSGEESASATPNAANDPS